MVDPLPIHDQPSAGHGPHVPIAGSYVVVGCEDADSAVARILSVEADGAIEVQVVPGKVEEHRHLLTTS
jgi:hypothetical protein